jgi:uncharacterized membrane protein YukC
MDVYGIIGTVVGSVIGIIFLVYYLFFNQNEKNLKSTDTSEKLLSSVRISSL